MVETAITRTPSRNQARFIASIRVLLALAIFIFAKDDLGDLSNIFKNGPAQCLIYLCLSFVLAIICRMSWWIEFRYFSFIFAIDTSAFLIIPSWMDENGLGYYTASFVMIIFLIFVSFARWGLRTSAVTALILNVACFTTCQIAMTGTVFFLHMDIMPFEEEVRRIAFQAALSFIMIIVLSRSAGALQIDDTRLSPDVLEIDYVAILKTAIAQAGARGGTLYWGHVDAHPSTWLGLTMTNSLHSTSTMQNEQITLPSDQLQAKLVDMNSRRAIGLDNDGRLIASTATQVDDAILAPIGRRNGIWTRLETASWAGWLALVDVRAAGWDKLVLAREIARHAEQALIQVELQALTNNAAVTRWRQSVARDLHDGVAQSLMGAQYWLRAMLRKEDLDEPTKSEINKLDSALSKEMKHIRETLKRVRDTEAAEKTWDLEIEMAALAETLSAYWNIEVVLCENVQTLAVTTTSMFNLQQFLREAVSNAVRHGRAALVTVDFSSDGGYLRFVVTDNGSGFREEPAKTYPKSLQERIAGLGGTIDVQSLPGGTRLEVLIDVQRLTTPSILPSGDTG